MKFNVVLESADEGGYTVFVPSLPGCISEGDTKAEALKNIIEAIELVEENGKPVTIFDLAGTGEGDPEELKRQLDNMRETDRQSGL